ncbi:MAG: nucleotidyltransferase family protein [Xanthomonadales bacterium]|nr:nucleotidyltransferase family protein [Xanthomonadales bacterium]
MNTSLKSAYSEPLDAIVLAGTDSNPRRMIEGQNKAFLEVAGEILVHRVVKALLEASTIGNILVVGPADRLRTALAGLPGEIIIVEQAGQMLSNAWAAISASESRYRRQTGTDDPLRPLLFISADIPLICSAAVDDFVTRCAFEDSKSPVKYAMLVGVAEESSLRQFYPEAGKEGINRPYVNFSNCRLRLANIYVGRPRGLSNHQFLQTGFSHRKAEKLKNVIILVWKFLSQHGGWRAACITLQLQATLAVSRNQGRLFRWLRTYNKITDTERSCGDVLGGPIRIVITPYGGLSLDVDNEEDYQVLTRRYQDWSRIGPVEPPD